MDEHAYRNSPKKNNQLQIKTKGEELPKGIGKEEKLFQFFIVSNFHFIWTWS